MPKLPHEPMVPILDENIPQGSEWGYQLKWDGVRILASVEKNAVELYSRRNLPKTQTYPEIVRSLLSLDIPCLLDGEAVSLDPKTAKPVFSKILQRERIGSPPLVLRMSQKEPVTYVLFDILYYKDQDVRALPYAERHALLKSLFPSPTPRLLVADLFDDGNGLWLWIEKHQWEGIVSKRLSSPYREGKKHRDWFKKKTKRTFDVDIVGITVKEGRLSSLIMTFGGWYFGRVSIGLNEGQKQTLMDYARARPADKAAITPLPGDLKGEGIIWLAEPFSCRVKGLEVTPAGALRHPQIVWLPEPFQTKGGKS